MSTTKGSKNNLANRGAKQPHVCRVVEMTATGKLRKVIDQAACQRSGLHR